MSSPAPRSRVVIIDDHTAIVEMTALVVESIPGHVVVGYTSEPKEAPALCRKLQPDVIVLDLGLPHGSGLSLLYELRAVCPKARVMLFSGRLPAAAIRGALGAGVLGFVEKRSPLSEFRSGIINVSAGQVYFSAHTREAIRTIVSHVSVEARDRVALTEREKAVLRLIAGGLSSKEIASKLGISVHTAINHRTNLMKKTRLHRVAQLSLYAARLGLVEESSAAEEPAVPRPDA